MTRNVKRYTKRRINKRKLRKKIKRILKRISIISFIILVFFVLKHKKTTPVTNDIPKKYNFLENNIYYNKETNNNLKESWKIIVVNKDNPLPDNHSIKTTTLKNGLSVDERIYDDLTKMIEDGNKQGLSLIVCSAYRTIDKQEDLFNQEIAIWKSKGLTEEQAYNKAKTSVLPPGTSEHNLGLAVDICSYEHQTLDEDFENTPEGKWLRENCTDYGFILRYPKDKQDITNIIYEPWHFRYVGKEYAKEIEKLGICLEEYITYLENTQQ